ncbi:HGGxSTG domain-containing protein [Serratia proteamaculans]|uniref:HGGxSTG domain-containing protein n=1 Tax=Serratia proteamaculans TaxID=28151 RepID=UPI0028F709CA|nr:HGGxSTG domain-containing protein [Serratia proteamaculans]
MSDKAEQLDRRNKWFELQEAEFKVWADRGYRYPSPSACSFPEELAEQTCGAKTRAGTPCKMRSIYANGRCKLHGGLSTGAKTSEGKARQLEGLYRWLEAKKAKGDKPC